METKIGIFLCNCGGTIRNIDFDTLAQRIAELSGDTSIYLGSDLCLEEGRERMISHIKKENIERVVIAACSPELREPVFYQVLEKAGLNWHLLSIANIREQCSWAHEGDVTEKAVELIKMAINRVRFLQPLHKKELLLNKEVLVIGGGLSGMSTALQLSRAGLRTTLLVSGFALEKGSGKLESFCTSNWDFVADAVHRDGKIEVLSSAQVAEVKGHLGGFSVGILKDGRKFIRKYGAIVVATGYQTKLSLDQTDVCDRNIVSQQEFRSMLDNPNLEKEPKTVGFVLDFCDEGSRFATVATLYNALEAKKRWSSEVYVFCRNVKVDSEGLERLYQQARNSGVIFLKCEAAPRIVVRNGQVEVEAQDVFLGEDVTLTCDVLVSEEIYLPCEGSEELSSLLKIRRDSVGFWQDNNVHLYPVASERKGIFLVGECRGNSDLGRVLADVSSVVANVVGLLSSGNVLVTAERVKADPQKCVACLTCIRVCPHSAIQLVRADSGKEVAGISDIACYACGICAALCPAKAIKFQGYRDEETLAQLEALTPTRNGLYVAFSCEHSAYPAADLAGKLGLHYPESLRIIRVPCAGQVDVFHMLKAYEKGAAGVLVIGCEDGACHHMTGNTRARERVTYCNTLLREAGTDYRPVVMFNVSPNAPHKFVRAVHEINRSTKKFGG